MRTSHLSLMHAWAPRLLLALVLLLAQLGLLQHQVEHALDGGDQVCELCLHQHALDGVSALPGLPFTTSSSVYQLAFIGTLFYYSARIFDHPARAPPHSLSS